MCFSATEEFSCLLQISDITLQDALLQSEVAMRFLDRNQSDEAYDHFYQLVVDKSSGLTNPPCLPRARRPPKRYDSGTAPHAYITPKDYFRHFILRFLT